MEYFPREREPRVQGRRGDATEQKGKEAKKNDKWRGEEYPRPP